MARLAGFEPACDPVTFLLIRSQGGYKRMVQVASAYSQEFLQVVGDRTHYTSANCLRYSSTATWVVFLVRFERTTFRFGRECSSPAELQEQGSIWVWREVEGPNNHGDLGAVGLHGVLRSSETFVV